MTIQLDNARLLNSRYLVNTAEWHMLVFDTDLFAA